MAAKVPAWHEVMELRDELRKGELAQALFAADLHAAVAGDGHAVYTAPDQFFGLTYPTANLKTLARDVVQRLRGQSDKAVRLLELTYGGGKTHAMLTLFHLVNDPEALPDLPAVNEFLADMGGRPPATRVVCISFDRLDAERGIKVKAPDGSATREGFRLPWTAMAWMLGGKAGLKVIQDGREERETAPTVDLFIELIKLGQADDRPVLILLDEILMWAAEWVRKDEARRQTVVNFFQSLSHAVASTPRTAMVASLLASDLAGSDAFGRGLHQAISSVLMREKEEPIKPVEQKDVAEVLRRRLFKPSSYMDMSRCATSVTAAVAGIASLDPEVERNRGETHDELQRSFPFDPAVTDAFYQKWTQLRSFQRTRGVLRIYAMALRDAAARKDPAPIAGLSIFLADKGENALSAAAQELTGIARSDEVEGRAQDWGAILQGELSKAREAQRDLGMLKHREIEQAVIGAFLHSQPAGQKATTQDMHRMLGATHPDRIELGKGLIQWARTSWFLDDEGSEDRDAAGVPKTWRLGVRPNLKQMHAQCLERVKAHADVEIASQLKSLKSHKDVTAAKLHRLPSSPADVPDDTEFRFVILGLDAACEAGKPSAAALRYLTDTTTSERKRGNKNQILVAVPSVAGLAAARDAARDALAWVEVEVELGKQDQAPDPLREQKLKAEKEGAQKVVPERVRAAWCIGVTFGRDGKPEAHQVTPDSRPLWTVFKGDPRFRIHDEAVNAEALQPGAPYHRAFGDPPKAVRWIRDVVSAFAEWTDLPKVVRPQAIRDTLVNGCDAGLFVLRSKRPDGSMRTWWRERPSATDLVEDTAEVALPEAVELTSVAVALIAPGGLPGVWAGDEARVDALVALFAGEQAYMVPSGHGAEEPRIVPKAQASVVHAAVRAAVAAGDVWLISGSASLWGEEVPEGLDLAGATLRKRPEALSPGWFSPTEAPSAWSEGSTDGARLAAAVSERAARTLPWPLVRDGINAAISTRVLSKVSGTWPCSWGDAATAVFGMPLTKPSDGPPPPKPKRPERPFGEARLSVGEMTLLADAVSAIGKAAGDGLDFVVRIELAGNASDATIAAVNAAIAESGANLVVERPR